MELYLLRHAIAEERSNDGSDSARMLTPEGAEKMRIGARGLRRLGVALDRLLTSPLTRARETAEIVGAALDVAPETVGALAPGCNAATLIDLLADMPRVKSVMVVGHEPDLSSMIADLTGGSRVIMKKGGLALIDLSSLELSAGSLLWVLPPKVLRALGK
ncbi:phosphohistidine phosphatase SixA [Roseiflexus castenholzii]|uniref:phosphohistidine phosphatase SixA n=1 Tax=Roseiflexus castenholzii TaxID=120962 RepID=UPI003C79BE09